MSAFLNTFLPHGRRHRLLAFVWVLAALVLASLLVGCGDRDGGTEGLASEPPVVEARLGYAQRTELPRRLEIQGTVEADQTSAVSTRVMAQITAVHVSAGDPVRRGQTLLEIDPQAARGQLAQAQGGLAQAQAQLALAERSFRRFEELAKTRAASELELDQARAQYQQARGAVEQAEGAVTAAAAVAADSTVRAPFSGQIVRRLVEVGDLAAPGRPLLVLQTGDSRRLVLPVPESIVSRSDLQVGDEVPLEIGVRSDLGTVQGVVTEMTPGADPLSHSFRVEVGLPPSLDGNGARPLPTGVAGRAWLPGGTRSAVTAPRDAVLHRGGMSLVVVRAVDGTARTRVVTLGITDGERVEVLSGLDGGETVLRGLATVPPSGAVVEELRASEEGSVEGPGTASEGKPPRVETATGEGGA